jgi:hypothetical protein
LGYSSNTVITGTYDLADDHEQVNTDSSSAFVASVALAWAEAMAWEEAMAIQDNATSIPNAGIGDSIFTFTPGTWHREGAITIAAYTNVTLDGGGDPEAQFLIQATTTMNVGAGCHIVLVNGAQAENVLWAINTVFTVGAGSYFKGSIMAGSVTFDANVVLDGSILAQTAVTLGANNAVYGCVVALTAITFDTGNSVVAVVQAVDYDVAIPAILTDFPALAYINDEFIIACIPLTGALPAGCDASSIAQDMDEMLNNCTQEGIIIGGGRRTSSVIVSMATLDEGGGSTGTFRGAGQKGRRLYSMCDAIDPPLSVILYCCIAGEYDYCGTPSCSTDPCRRRELQGGGTDAGVEQYLPSISQECSSQFQALEQDAYPTCFLPGASDLLDLKCHAILVTGGE